MSYATVTALNGEDSIDTLWWVEIDGLRPRFGTAVPAWSPTDTTANQPVLAYMSDMLQVRPQKVEPLNGKTTAHGISVSLVDVDDDVTELFSVHDRTNKHWTTVASNCTASAATLHVTATSAFATPCAIYVEGETMWAASKTTLTFAVTRGVWGSQAKDHLLTDDAGMVQSLEVWDGPRYIVGRGVTLYESREGLAEADCAKIRCVIDSIKEDMGIWTIAASGHLNKMAAQVNRFPPWRYIERKDFAGWITVYGGSGTMPTPTTSLLPWVQFGEQFYEYTSLQSFDVFPDFDIITFNPQPVYLIPNFANSVATNGAEDMGSVFDAEGKVSGFGMTFVEGDTVHLACSHTLFYNGATSLRDPLSVILCILLSQNGTVRTTRRMTFSRRASASGGLPRGLTLRVSRPCETSTVSRTYSFRSSSSQAKTRRSGSRKTFSGPTCCFSSSVGTAP